MSVRGDFPACAGCGLLVEDVTRSRRDGQPRCRPCERRADHKRRIARGDSWYLDRIADFAESLYGDNWRAGFGFEWCAEVFADTRALCGWAGVGVDPDAEFPRQPKPIRSRPCPKCGETTTSATGFLCGGCHFRGWWGRWA